MRAPVEVCPEDLGERKGNLGRQGSIKAMIPLKAEEYAYDLGILTPGRLR